MIAFSLIAERALGALHLRDALTGASLVREFKLTIAGIPVPRQRSGLYLVGRQHDTGAELVDYADATLPVADTPPVASVRMNVRIVDPAREYFDTEVRIALPREPLRAVAGNRFAPIAIDLHRRGNAAVLPNWTVLRTTLLAETTPRPHALVRATAGTRVLSALTGTDGQALIAFFDQPIFAPVGGQVRRTLSVSLTVHADSVAPLADVSAEIERLAATAARSARPIVDQLAGTTALAQSIDLPTGEASSLVLELL